MNLLRFLNPRTPTLIMTKNLSEGEDPHVTATESDHSSILFSQL